MASKTSKLPYEFRFPGVPLEDIVRAHAERGDYGEGDVEELVLTRLKDAYYNKVPNKEISLPNGNLKN